MITDVRPARDRTAAVRRALAARMIASFAVVVVIASLALSWSDAIYAGALIAVAAAFIATGAMLLGLITLLMSGRTPNEHRPRLRRHAWIAMGMGVLCFPLSWYVMQPSLERLNRVSRLSVQASKLSNVYGAVYRYHKSHGRLPEHPAVLVGGELDRMNFVSPYRRAGTPPWPEQLDENVFRYGDWVFTYPGVPMDDGQRVFAFSVRLRREETDHWSAPPSGFPDDLRHVVYMDGHIVAETEEHFRKYLVEENRIRVEQYELPPIDPARFDGLAAGDSGD